MTNKVMEERLVILEDHRRRTEEDLGSIDTSLKEISKELKELDKAVNNHISHISLSQWGLGILQLLTLLTILGDFYKFIIK